jgi:hypothetical protein
VDGKGQRRTIRWFLGRTDEPDFVRPPRDCSRYLLLGVEPALSGTR